MPQLSLVPTAPTIEGWPGWVDLGQHTHVHRFFAVDSRKRNLSAEHQKRKLWSGNIHFWETMGDLLSFCICSIVFTVSGHVCLRTTWYCIGCSNRKLIASFVVCVTWRCLICLHVPVVADLCSSTLLWLGLQSLVMLCLAQLSLLLVVLGVLLSLTCPPTTVSWTVTTMLTTVHGRSDQTRISTSRLVTSLVALRKFVINRAIVFVSTSWNTFIG